MELTVGLAYLTLFIGVPLNVVTTILLHRASHRSPGLRVLRERYIASLVLTVVLIVFGLIFVNNDQAVPPISDVATKVITRIAMLVLAFVPAVGWLLIYRRRRP